MAEINLEVDVNRHSQRTASAQTSRVFSGSRTTEIERGFPSGVRIKPMSMTAVEKTQANHFLKLGCAKLIRPIYAQLHRSNSPSYRRAVWDAWWLWLVFFPRSGMTRAIDEARLVERNATKVQIMLLMLSTVCGA